MQFFGRTPIQGEARERSIAYCHAEAVLAAFQGAESDAFNYALTKYGNLEYLDTDAATQLARSARRLRHAAQELIARRRTDLPEPFQEVAKLWSASEVKHLAYRSWAEAQAATIEAIAEGRLPRDERNDRLNNEHVVATKKAETEFGKLLKRLRLNASEANDLMAIMTPALDVQPTATVDQMAVEDLDEDGAEWAVRKSDWPDLVEAIISASFFGTASLEGALGQKLSDDQQWEIKVEFVGFFLHYVDRLAFQLAGPEFRAELQDQLLPYAVMGLVNRSLARPADIPAAEAIGLENRLFNATTKRVNEAGAEYAGLPLLGTSDSTVIVFDRLEAKVAYHLGGAGGSLPRGAVAAATMKEIQDAQLTDLVEAAQRAWTR